MKNMKELTKVMKGLERVSEKIIKTSLAIMLQVQNEDSEFIDDLAEMRGLPEETVDREELLFDLQDASMGWTSDAESVKRELPNFIMSDGHEMFRINDEPEECPFLTEVWNGDLYDKTGMDGLKELLKQLGDHLQTITAENLINRAFQARSVKI